MFFTFDRWWCCQAPVEQEVVVALLAHWYDLSFHVFVDEFDLIWAAADPLNNTHRKETFVQAYGLILTDCPIGEEETAPCYAYTWTIWLAIATLNDFFGLDCPDPCVLNPPYVYP